MVTVGMKLSDLPQVERNAEIETTAPFAFQICNLGPNNDILGKCDRITEEFIYF